MKIIVFVSAMLIAQVSTSFYDYLEGAMESKYAKMVGNVVTDVKDTMDCTVLAVKNAFSLSAEATARYNEECGDGADNNETAVKPVEDTAPKMEITIEFMDNNQGNANGETPAEIDAKINESVSKLLDKYNNKDKLESLGTVLSEETKLLQSVSNLVNQELANLSHDVNVDIKKTNKNDTQPSIDTVLAEIKLLENKEHDTKNASEAAQIHQVIDDVLNKLNVISATEATENIKIEEILSDLEKKSNNSYSDLRHKFEDWKDDEAKHLDDINTKIEEHDRLFNETNMNATSTKYPFTNNTTNNKETTLTPISEPTLNYTVTTSTQSTATESPISHNSLLSTDSSSIAESNKESISIVSDQSTTPILFIHDSVTTSKPNSAFDTTEINTESVVNNVIRSTTISVIELTSAIYALDATDASENSRSSIETTTVISDKFTTNQMTLRSPNESGDNNNDTDLSRNTPTTFPESTAQNDPDASSDSDNNSTNSYGISPTSSVESTTVIFTDLPRDSPNNSVESSTVASDQSTVTQTTLDHTDGLVDDNDPTEGSRNVPKSFEESTTVASVTQKHPDGIGENDNNFTDSSGNSPQRSSGSSSTSSVESTSQISDLLSATQITLNPLKGTGDNDSNSTGLSENPSKSFIEHTTVISVTQNNSDGRGDSNNNSIDSTDNSPSFAESTTVASNNLTATHIIIDDSDGLGDDNNSIEIPRNSPTSFVESTTVAFGPQTHPDSIGEHDNSFTDTSGNSPTSSSGNSPTSSVESTTLISDQLSSTPITLNPFDDSDDNDSNSTDLSKKFSISFVETTTVISATQNHPDSRGDVDNNSLDSTENSARFVDLSTVVSDHLTATAITLDHSDGIGDSPISFVDSTTVASVIQNHSDGTGENDNIEGNMSTSSSGNSQTSFVESTTLISDQLIATQITLNPLDGSAVNDSNSTDLSENNSTNFVETTTVTAATQNHPDSSGNSTNNYIDSITNSPSFVEFRTVVPDQLTATQITFDHTYGVSDDNNSTELSRNSATSFEESTAITPVTYSNFTDSSGNTPQSSSANSIQVTSFIESTTLMSDQLSATQITLKPNDDSGVNDRKSTDLSGDSSISFVETTTVVSSTQNHPDSNSTFLSENAGTLNRRDSSSSDSFSNSPTSFVESTTAAYNNLTATQMTVNNLTDGSGYYDNGTNSLANFPSISMESTTAAASRDVTKTSDIHNSDNTVNNFPSAVESTTLHYIQSTPKIHVSESAPNIITNNDALITSSTMAPGLNVMPTLTERPFSPDLMKPRDGIVVQGNPYKEPTNRDKFIAGPIPTTFANKNMQPQYHPPVQNIRNPFNANGTPQNANRPPVIVPTPIPTTTDFFNPKHIESMIESLNKVFENPPPPPPPITPSLELQKLENRFLNAQLLPKPPAYSPVNPYQHPMAVNTPNRPQDINNQRNFMSPQNSLNSPQDNRYRPNMPLTPKSPNMPLNYYNKPQYGRPLNPINPSSFLSGPSMRDPRAAAVPNNSPEHQRAIEEARRLIEEEKRQRLIMDSIYKNKRGGRSVFGNLG